MATDLERAPMLAEKARRAPDPRPARTRAAILDAIDRLGTAGREVTVASIVAEAQLSRSSFYSQFKDLGDVAVQLMAEIAAEMEAYDKRARDLGRHAEANLGTTRLLIEELQRRRGLYSAVLGGSATVDASRAIYQRMALGLEKAVRRTAPPEINPRTASVYIVSGTLIVLVDWLCSEDPVPAEQILREVTSMMPAWLK